MLQGIRPVFKFNVVIVSIYVIKRGKNMFKKIIASVLATLMFLIVLPTKVNATSCQLPYDVIFAGGKEIKVSTEMSESEKEELVSLFNEIPALSTEGVFTEINQRTTTFANENISYDSHNITRSVIPTSTLTLKMIKSDVSSGSQKIYNIQAIAIWKNAPFFKNKDQFALAWGGNFAVTSYSSSAYWKAGDQGFLVTCPLSTITPNAGIAYEYQCGNDNNNFSFNPWYVQVNATISHAAGSGNNPVNVVAEYAHKTLALGSINVSISPGSVNFSANGACTYDTASPVSTVVYY